MQGTDRGRYDCRTRNGNWFEESVLEGEKLREFLEKKERGELTIQRIRQNLVPINLVLERGDGNLHYGQMVKIVNDQLDCNVCCDPGDAENKDEQIYAATGGRTPNATARNVWVLRKFEEHTILPSAVSDDDDTVVRYGDKFYLETTEHIGSEKFYLASMALDWTHFSRVSRKQLVYSTPKESYAAVWTIGTIERDADPEYEGEPVNLNTPVFIKHCQTCAPLSAHEVSYFNDYGNEYELIAGRLPGKCMVWHFTTQ